MHSPFGQGPLLRDLGRQYQAIVRWALTADAPLPARLAQLTQQVKAFFIELVDEQGPSFANHFARMSYVGQVAQLPPRLTYYLHQFDREAAAHLRENETHLDGQQILLLGSRALTDVIAAVTQLPCPPDLVDLLPTDYGAFRLRSYEVAEFKPQLRALVLEHLEARQVLRVRLVEEPGLDHVVHYARAGYNERFVQPAVRLIARYFELPLEVNLLAVEVDTEGELVPGHLIIDPDYLVDITSISKCFDHNGAKAVRYLLGRLSPRTSSWKMLAGNVANHFLDQAVARRSKPFEASFRESFKLYPLEYVRLGDGELRELMAACENHYRVIADCVARHLPRESINCDKAEVEPSFYAERYGIQGRLDLFIPPHGGRDAAIVELKSGSIYRPNNHKLNWEHYIQTLLYDLLVKSVFGDRTDARNYILYSRDKELPLRYAPRNKAKQYEALSVRNQMMATERLLAASQPGQTSPLDHLTPERFGDLTGFEKRNLHAFHQAYSGLSDLERDYLRAFTGFIAREQRLAKVGCHGTERISGQSALWREDLAVKREGYAILDGLELQQIAQRDEVPILTFRRPAALDANLTSFRRGDIVVLYPGDPSKRAVLHHQVNKGTILGIDADRVKVQLRASQPDLTRFEDYAAWNIEGDLFDSSFGQLYGNLMEFAAAPSNARRLVLGLQAPREVVPAEVRPPYDLTQEQAAIFRQIVAAEDYYLLWGPPGTGKTSMVLRHLCDHFVNRTNERLLIVAYTNRAVDEICRALADVSSDIERKYLRVGSAHSCGEEWRNSLLQARIQHARSRDEIKELLRAQRIVVGTVSSVLGKGENLFSLVDFDRLIVDEASQLLEPALANLLARYPRAVLIGDHRQLPAVVTQAPRETRVSHEPLREIGLVDLRNSLFERLFERCKAQGWTWAYGQLTRQGRMHGELAAYANAAFYENKLQIIGRQQPSEDWQQLPNRYKSPPADDCSELDTLFCERSFVFVDTPVDLSDKAFRTNQHEATAIVDAIGALARIRQCDHYTLKPGDIGIITPYRAQIARLRTAIQQSALAPHWDQINVDTVERYQGSSYRIVILSLCANQGSQVAQLSSLNHEGVDRKLNVALTRAKERVIAFGNVDLLNDHNPAYRRFIAHCVTTGGLYRPEVAELAMPA